MGRGWRYCLPLGRLLCLTLLTYSLLIGTSLAQYKYIQKAVLLSGEVDVTVTYALRGQEWDESLPGPRYWGDVTIHVTRGDISFEVPYLSLSRTSPNGVIEGIRESTGWKDGYLFIPSECGGGTSWRCETEYVFAVRQGKLIKVGEFAVTMGPNTPGLGSSYAHGFFYDVWGRLEANPFTSHASAPFFFMVMKEEDGVLAPDLDRTWEHNRETYKEKLEFIRHYDRGKPSDDTRRQSLASSLLLCAALAKYCDRQPELDLAMRQAKYLLPDKEFGVFQDLIERRVVKGNTPQKN
ncbi:MAG: hypothetical protein AB1664_07270 [Thermodesulfobacteriota bacterium]